jgi:hypothetical protein
MGTIRYDAKEYDASAKAGPPVVCTPRGTLTKSVLLSGTLSTGHPGLCGVALVGRLHDGVFVRLADI